MPPIKVLVVDDAVVIRKLVTDVINSDPDLEVIGTAPNGKIALAKLQQLNPDIMTLDIEMPEMDGLETLPELRKVHPDLPVIMFSTLTVRGSESTLEALARGATDYVAKPANVGSTTEALDTLREELLPRLKALVPGRIQTKESTITAAVKTTNTLSPTTHPGIEAVVLGTSTGGPTALETVLASMAKPLPVPLFIVQHIPETFSRLLAERLDKHCVMDVVEAADGMIAEGGTAYIAPGGLHMKISRRGTDVVIHVGDGPLVNSCKPAVDVLFESAVPVYGSHQLGVILTGMGQDGLVGCEGLSEAGAPILAQDEASSVVWGMPGYVAQKGLADEILPLEDVERRITTWVGKGAFLTGVGAR